MHLYNILFFLLIIVISFRIIVMLTNMQVCHRVLVKQYLTLTPLVLKLHFYFLKIYLVLRKITLVKFYLILVAWGIELA